MKITGHKKILILAILPILLNFLSPLKVTADDSVFETNQLIVSDIKAGNLSHLGYSTDIDDDTVVVGAPLAGAAYVFSRTGEGWNGGIKLTVDSALRVLLGFAYSVSIGGNGNTVVVGAPFPGAVYVFEREGESWDFKTTITNGGGFGFSVDVQDNTLVVGNPFSAGGGAVYVFEREGESWDLKTTITNGGGFGFSVAMDASSFVVGAPGIGEAYVYRLNENNTWDEIPDATLPPNGSEPVPNFGTSVSISGKTLAVGAASAVPPDYSLEPGSVYVFRYNETSDLWNQENIPFPEANGLGSSVAVTGNRVVVGAALDDVTIDNPEEMLIPTAGSAYMFKRESSDDEPEWVLEAKLSASDADDRQRFGWSVSVDNDTLVVGAPFKDPADFTDSNAAYVYDLPAAEEPPLVEILSVSTGKEYELRTAEVDALQYIDRGYKIKRMSDRLSGSVLVATANNDKWEDRLDHLRLQINRSAELFVAYDKRGACRRPSWLKEDGWERTNEYIKTSDWPASPLEVFKKSIDNPPQEVILPGNHYGGDTKARSNYFVLVKEPQEDIVTIEEVFSHGHYSLAGAVKGARPYTDRPYRIKAISAGLEGGVLVCTPNNDKRSRKEKKLELRVNEDANVFVIYDKRGARRPPDWLEDGWERTRAYIKTSYWPSSPMTVFKRSFEADERIILGGNRSGGGWKAKSNYFVIVKKPEEKTVDLVKILAPKKYRLSTAKVCAHPYIDRKYKIKKMSRELKGGVLVRTANDDKWKRDPEHLNLALGASAEVYVCYDKRGADNLPDWLVDWELTDFFVKTTDRPASPLVVLRTHVEDAGELIFGGNQSSYYDTGARSNYFVIIK